MAIHFDRASGTELPWPAVTDKQAASQLGVDLEIVRMLINKGKMTGLKVKTVRGNTKWLVQQESLRMLRQQMAKSLG